MSVLLKITMPKTCEVCPCNDDNWRCGATREYFDYDDMCERRRADCPLIEIPTPHGRLIDADALIADLVKYQNTLDPESRENARVLSVKSYLTLARGEAIIEAED